MSCYETKIQHSTLEYDCYVLKMRFQDQEKDKALIDDSGGCVHQQSCFVARMVTS